MSNDSESAASRMLKLGRELAESGPIDLGQCFCDCGATNMAFTSGAAWATATHTKGCAIYRAQYGDMDR